MVTREEGDGEHRSYRAIKLTKFRELPQGIKLFAHGDPGLVNDSFSMAFGYAVPAMIMSKTVASDVLQPMQLVQRKLKPDDVIDWEVDVTRTVIVAVIVWRPDPRLGIQVDLQNIEDTIFELREHYPSLGHWTKEVRATRSPSRASHSTTGTRRSRFNG